MSWENFEPILCIKSHYQAILLLFIMIKSGPSIWDTCIPSPFPVCCFNWTDFKCSRTTNCEWTCQSASVRVICLPPPTWNQREIITYPYNLHERYRQSCLSDLWMVCSIGNNVRCLGLRLLADFCASALYSLVNRRYQNQSTKSMLYQKKWSNIIGIKIT